MVEESVLPDGPATRGAVTSAFRAVLGFARRERCSARMLVPMNGRTVRSRARHEVPEMGTLAGAGNRAFQDRACPGWLRDVTLPLMADMQITLPMQANAPVKNLSMNIGGTIRDYRLHKGMSQGDIEKRTGLLRCYLSRVENGHTVPSLETLQKIAGALDLQLSEFFAETEPTREVSSLNLNEEEIRFLTQVQRYSANLSDSDRRLLLAMVKKFASTAVV